MSQKENFTANNLNWDQPHIPIIGAYFNYWVQSIVLLKPTTNRHLNSQMYFYSVLKCFDAHKMQCIKTKVIIINYVFILLHIYTNIFMYIY